MIKKKIRILQVNGKVQHLSDIYSVIETNTILNKTITGIGATYSEIKAPRHSIIIEPTKPVIYGKTHDPKHKDDNLFGVCQGVYSDKIAEYLHSIGVKDMLVDIGEIYCEGVNQNGIPWSIGIDRPFDGNMTPGADLDGIWRGDGSGRGVVTSGNYRKFYEKDGKKYSHTIDPRTGYPVTHNLLSATIVAPDAVTADAYATYCKVIGLDEAKAFINSRSDIEGYLIYDVDGNMTEWASSGFKLVGK